MIYLPDYDRYGCEVCESHWNGDKTREHPHPKPEQSPDAPPQSLVTTPSTEQLVIRKAALSRGTAKRHSNRNADTQFNIAVDALERSGMIECNRNHAPLRWTLTGDGNAYASKLGLLPDERAPIPPICKQDKKKTKRGKRPAKISEDNLPYAAVLAPTFYYVATVDKVLATDILAINKVCNALRPAFTAEQVQQICGEVDAERQRQHDNSDHWIHNLTAHGLCNNGRAQKFLQAASGGTQDNDDSVKIQIPD